MQQPKCESTYSIGQDERLVCSGYHLKRFSDEAHSAVAYNLRWFGLTRRQTVWRKTNWDDPDIQEDDFTGGTLLKLEFHDGSVVVGKLTVEPTQPAVWKQNDKCVMARVSTSFSGDTWLNVYGADVYVWEIDPWYHGKK